MIKTLLAIVMLTFSLNANATHHRGHAVMHLDNAILRLGQSVNAARLYRDQDARGMLTVTEQAEFDSFKGQPKQEALIAAWVGQKKAENPDGTAIYNQISHANKYIIYANKYLNRLDAARTQLLTGGDLDEIRRLINSPGSTGELESGLWGFSSVDSIWESLVSAELTNYTRFRGVHTLSRKAHQSANWALWHVNDGIREEIYQDPIFICSGPNNHCGQ